MCGSLDSGLCVVLIILSALLLAVAVLLFYDFENVCENSNPNNITNMVGRECIFGISLWKMITFKLSIISKLHASIYANIFKFSREQFPQNDFSEIKTNHYVCSQLLSEKLLLKTRWDTNSRLAWRIFFRFSKISLYL